MQNLFNANAMLRVLIPYLLGILLAAYAGTSAQIHIFTISILILGLLTSVWVFRPTRFRLFTLRHVSAILFTTLFLVLGYLFYLNQQSQYHTTHYTKYTKQPNLIQLRISETVIEKPNSYKCKAEIIGIRDSSHQWHTTTGEILLYFAKSEAPDLNYGDQIIANIRLQDIPPAKNPYAFDYAKFMARHHIFHQAFVKNGHWTLSQRYSGNNLKYHSIQIRNQLLNILNHYPLPPQEIAIASAMLLGYDDYIAPEQRQQFAASGALHILCVSGLHVGIIFMIFHGLFGFMMQRQWSQHLYYLLLLGTIWSYAFITGLAPPVLRASTMFSIIIVGKILNRRSSIYNSLAASAFLLLLLRPEFIFNIGFQFSYLSVLAIFFFQPRLSQCYRSRYAIINKLIDLSAVSIAAQLGLFPLAIYYFHLFPHYFLLSNIFVIPLSFAILLTGMLNFALMAVGLASTFISSLALAILHILLWLLTHIVGWIEALPWAFSEHLYFSTIETIMLYLIIISLSIGLIWRNYRFSMIGLLLSLLFFVYNIAGRYSSLQQNSLYILYDKKTPCISVLQGRHSTVISYGNKMVDIQFAYTPFYALHLHQRIQKTISIISKHTKHKVVNGIYINKNSLVWQQHSLCIINQEDLLPQSDSTVFFNTVVLSHNPPISIAKLQKSIRTNTIVFDATNSTWRIQKWQQECDKLGIACYDIKTKGAYQLLQH